MSLRFRSLLIVVAMVASLAIVLMPRRDLARNPHSGPPPPGPPPSQLTALALTAQFYRTRTARAQTEAARPTITRTPTKHLTGTPTNTPTITPTPCAEGTSSAPLRGDLKWLSTDGKDASSVAWGDVDGDGDLDLAAAGGPSVLAAAGGPSVYLNEGGRLEESSASLRIGPAVDTRSVAWGDADGDGDLDLAAGNWDAPSEVYLNEGKNSDGTLRLSDIMWRSDTDNNTTSVAWGDVDGDGDLDLAEGNGCEEVDNRPQCGQTKVYLNQGTNADGTLRLESVWAAEEVETQSVAWGDVDGDGDLDLAVGNFKSPNRVYVNEWVAGVNTDGKLPLVEGWKSTGKHDTMSLAWGDADGDGDLDLAVGNWSDPSEVYLNNGKDPSNKTLRLVSAWSSAKDSYTFSVAWGDVDGDGDLDLAAGNNCFLVGPDGNKTLVCPKDTVFMNDGKNADGTLQLLPGWQSIDEDGTRSVAWGDMDGDRDLDLAVANSGARIMVYRNEGLRLAKDAVWKSSDPNNTQSVAWGDVDGDGDLDLASANTGKSGFATVFLNAGGRLVKKAVLKSSDGEDDTRSVAWGDVDGDGDLDLAAGNGCVVGEGDTVCHPSNVYINEGNNPDETLRFLERWTSDANDTRSVAWGDVDGDGDLDLATGNHCYIDKSNGTEKCSPIKVYLNEDEHPDGMLRLIDGWRSNDTDNNNTTSVAWGDIDGDGDLDLAAGNNCRVKSSTERELCATSKMYLNEGKGVDGKLRLVTAWQSSNADNTSSIAWGDVDGDGDLDLAVGNAGSPNKVYLNTDGRLGEEAAWIADVARNTTSIAWGDVDGDGDLDLAAGNEGAPNNVYLNEGKFSDGTLRLNDAWLSNDADNTTSVAWGDLDGDGDLDLAVGSNGASTKVYLNPSPSQPPGCGSAPDFAVLEAHQARYYSSSKVHAEESIPITYTIRGSVAEGANLLGALYSPDGGGRWYTATAATGTITRNLKLNIPQLFRWDTFKSGFFGRSDNVVLRLQASIGGFTRTHGTAGPYQRSALTTQTMPFRVRGTQVRAVRSGSQPAPIPLASVWRLLAGQTRDAAAIGNGRRAFATDRLGYLEGRGELKIGDLIAALEPVTPTDAVTFTKAISYFHTSAAPSTSGLDLKEVAAGGVQTVTVSPDNKLLLFNLDVSLEWDARRDAEYLLRLRSELERTSEILFDWTNGQVALGDVRVHHDRREWGEADIRIYASNRLRPNAAQGGIVAVPITETLTLHDPTRTSRVVYEPGHVRIGPQWNRYGEAGGSLGEDWSQTLAHELGHYLFFLDDNYLGIDGTGRLTQVVGCPGAMSSPYRVDWHEFHPADTLTDTRSVGWDWIGRCSQTLSAHATGRADWTTIGNFYPMLRLPDNPMNAGPSTLPLGVTRVMFVEPTLPSRRTVIQPRALEVPIYDVIGPGGGYRANASARAFRFAGEQVIDLGQPSLDQLVAHGASPGERVCVFDQAKGLAGCEAVKRDDSELRLAQLQAWEPEVVVTPISTTHITVAVLGVASGKPLAARLYPVEDPATACISLIRQGNAYVGQFRGLKESALEGFIHVWVERDGDPVRCLAPAGDLPAYASGEGEVVVDYSLGGNPGPRKLRAGPRKLRAGPRKLRAAPALSSDGQVMLFGEADFDDREIFALQPATKEPSIPAWYTLVGRAYRVTATAGSPSLTNSDPDQPTISISFNYLERDVPPGEEGFLRLYKRNDASSTWEPLDTNLDQEHNVASAATRGLGLYALMATVEIELYGPGWNLASFPIQGTRPVTEALQSIEPYYSTVYGLDARNRTAPWTAWRIRDVTAPGWVNDLHHLEFARGYWIRITDPVTLTWRLRGASRTSALGPAAGQRADGPNRQDAPAEAPLATYYGHIAAGPGWTPTVGMTVTARIGSRVCGEAKTQQEDGEIVYRLIVVGDGVGGEEGCGAPGRSVAITVSDRVMAPEPEWSNEGAIRLDLAPATGVATPTATVAASTTPSPTPRAPTPMPTVSATATGLRTATSTSTPTPTARRTPSATRVPSLTPTRIRPPNTNQRVYLPVVYRSRPLVQPTPRPRTATPRPRTATPRPRTATPTPIRPRLFR